MTEGDEAERSRALQKVTQLEMALYDAGVDARVWQQNGRVIVALKPGAVDDLLRGM